MYTANTMASAIEAMGMTLPYSSSLPATDPGKLAECRRAGDVIRHCLEKDIKPRDMMTREAFENAMALVMAVGGSTNAVLHLIAMARAVDVPLTIDDFQRTSDRVPYLADLRPSGKVRAGRFAPGRRHAGRDEAAAWTKDCITGDCLTITGKTIAENLAELAGTCDGPRRCAAGFQSDQDAPATSASCAATSAPMAPWPRSPARKACSFTGTANCFDSEEEMLAAMQQKQDQKGRRRRHSLRRSARRPGMPEMLSPTGSIVGAGLATDVALITDGRFSGGSAGFIVGHVTPEAQVGGPIALVQNGDQITIDAEANTITIDLSADELARRRASWTAPPYKATRGTLYKYIKNVKSASEGCVTDE